MLAERFVADAGPTVVVHLHPGWLSIPAYHAHRPSGEPVKVIDIEAAAPQIVTYRRRANNPYLMQAKYHRQREPKPWLGNKILRLQFA